jgi:sec-independent protein translocase protein TatB
MFPEGRIFDFVIIGVLALIVVGPKDLPILMRKVGKFLAHMRGMAAEFRASFDEMARQSELDELRKEVEALRSGQSLQAAVGLGDDLGVQSVMDDIHASLQSGEVQLHPPMSRQMTVLEPDVAVLATAESGSDPAPALTPLPTALPTATTTLGPAGETSAVQALP